MNQLEDVKGIMQLYMLDSSCFSPNAWTRSRSYNATAIPCLNFSTLPAGAVLHLLPSTSFFPTQVIWDWDLSVALFSCALKAVL